MWVARRKFSAFHGCGVFVCALKIVACRAGVSTQSTKVVAFGTGTIGVPATVHYFAPPVPLLLLPWKRNRKRVEEEL